MRTWLGIASAIGCATLAFACSSDSAKSGGPDPTIKITDPADKATVTITEDPDVPIGFTVTNFTLKEAPSRADAGAATVLATCAGAADCGHVHIAVDGHSCDDHEDGETNTFNHESATSPIFAGLDYCTDAVTGIPKEKAYPVVLTLYRDDETQVMDSLGKPVMDSIEINVKVMPPTDGGANGDGGP
jgi:hypothetical protein